MLGNAVKSRILKILKNINLKKHLTTVRFLNALEIVKSSNYRLYTVLASSKQSKILKKIYKLYTHHKTKS